MSSPQSKCSATLYEVLQTSIGKHVLVKLRDNCEVRGVLKSFDQHVNLLIEDAEEIVGERTVRRGTMIIRGDTVLLVSPIV